MLAACAEGAPDRLHLHASYDAAWYQDDQPFTPGHSARLGDLTAVHSWVFNGTAQRHGRASVPAEHHAAYLVELSKAWAEEPHRPVWLQEVGAPVPLVPPSTPPPSPRRPSPTPWTARTCGASPGGAPTTSPATSPTSPNFEYGLGLLTNDRTPKDVARVLAGAARGPHTVPAPRTTALVVPGDPGRRSRCAPGGAVFDAFFRLVADGARPTTVLDTRADDKEHLAARGVTELVAPDQVLPAVPGQ